MRSTVLHVMYAVVGVIVFMFVTIGWHAALITTCFAALAAMALSLGFVSTLNSSNDLDKAYDISYTHYADVFDNVLSVFTFDGESIEMYKSKRNHEAVLTALRTSFWRISAARTGTVVLIGLYVISLLFLLYRVYLKGGPKAARVGSAGMVMFFFTGQINGFLSHVWPLSYDTSVLRRLDTYLTEKIMQKSSPMCFDAVESNVNGYFIGRNLEYTYSAETKPFTVASDVTLQVNKIYHLEGEVGAGKSTFMHLLSGRFRPSDDRLFEGTDLCTLATEDLARMILYIPQVPMLFNRSILENIVYPKLESEVTPIEKGKINEQLKKLKLPLDLATVLRHNGENVSGGQRQMIYLLRLWFHSKNMGIAKAVLLDEPFSSIGDDQEKAVKQALGDMIAEIGRNKVTVIISHSKFDDMMKQKVISAGTVSNRVWTPTK